MCSLWSKITWGRMRIVLMLLAFSASAWGRIIHVDDDALPPGDGISWDTAYTYLQDALMTAQDGDEIRVGQGIYRPDDFVLSERPNMGRAESFGLKNGVIIKGGYAGRDEPDPNERDVELYETILSGDLEGNDAEVEDVLDLLLHPSRSDNSIHVVRADGTNATAVLEGFTISSGNADHSDWAEPDSDGGGLYGLDGSYQLRECKFVSNTARWDGGAVFNGHGDPIMANCTFERNCAGDRSGGHGGAIDTGGRPILTNCLFSGNRGGQGGAINAMMCQWTIRDCKFVANSANFGGGIQTKDCISGELEWCYFEMNSSHNGGAIRFINSDSTLSHNVFVGNIASSLGGAICVSSRSVVKVGNCTFAGNSAETGTALACGTHADRPSDLEVNASILWDGGNEIGNVDGSQIRVTYSDVDDGGRGSWPGEGNIRYDPLFFAPEDGDFHLKSERGRWDPNEGRWVTDDVTSPCVDAGDPVSDWTEELWPHGKRINIGAYGGTREASMSLSHLGSAADINLDGVVDFRDFDDFTNMLWAEQALLREDIDRNGEVNYLDFNTFAEEWYWNHFAMAHLEAAIELYKTEFGVYPPSGALDAVMSDYCGAMKLCEAMVGQDLLGFHPASAFRVDGLDAAGTFDLYSPSTLSERRSPFLGVQHAFEISEIWFYGTGSFVPTSRILCDMYKRTLPSGEEAGMPILYYRADPNGTLHDPSLVGAMSPLDNRGNIYNWLDNHDLLDLGVPSPLPAGIAHHLLSDPVKFYDMTRDKRVTTTSVPYNPDSYILISAGPDGHYGTGDDLTNFDR